MDTDEDFKNIMRWILSISTAGWSELVGVRWPRAHVCILETGYWQKMMGKVSQLGLMFRYMDRWYV